MRILTRLHSRSLSAKSSMVNNFRSIVGPSFDCQHRTTQTAPATSQSSTHHTNKLFPPSLSQLQTQYTRPAYLPLIHLTASHCQHTATTNAPKTSPSFIHRCNRPLLLIHAQPTFRLFTHRTSQIGRRRGYHSQLHGLAQSRTFSASDAQAAR